MKEEYWRETLQVNRIQYAYMVLRAKTKYAIMSRGTGKSFIVGAEVDENIRLMPRGVTTIAQATIGQALTKTLPSTFKMLEMLGYKPYDYNTHTGDYVVCRNPPDGWYRPYERIMQYDHVISFSNGHCLYILTQEGNSRGPNADFNITDEALTISKAKFDQEVAPTNRGNEYLFGKRSAHPVLKHHGNCFLSSMPYTSEQNWLLDPAEYYERERGIDLFAKWNKMVNVQMSMIEASIAKDTHLFTDLWNECVRMRREMTPFVSKDQTLFILGSVFDNIENLGMQYVINQYNVMDKLSFMVEILNMRLDAVDHCYYKLNPERHQYVNAFNDTFIRDVAEDTRFNWEALRNVQDSRADLDCDPSRGLEICPDWGSRASFLTVYQERHYDFATKKSTARPVECMINEFFVRRDDETDTEVNALADKFIAYYSHHPTKRVILDRDRYGDARRANSKKSYNELFIERLQRYGWQVQQRVHAGMEPPQHDKYLLMTLILTETDERFPVLRINATRCRHALISMNNTRVVESNGKFEKDKSSERRKSVVPEEATHFGDTLDKHIWTKYGERLRKLHNTFAPARV